MARGRIPKPKAINDLKGDPGKRRRHRAEPVPPKEKPTCPEHLSDVAKAEWHFITAQLDLMGMLSNADARSLELYAAAYSRYRKAEALVDQGLGIMEGKDSGFPVLTGYQTAMNQAAEQCRKWLIEFGLTPAARSRMAIPSQQSGAHSALMNKYVHRKA